MRLDVQVRYLVPFVSCAARPRPTRATCHREQAGSAFLPRVDFHLITSFNEGRAAQAMMLLLAMWAQTARSTAQ
jgi:hypothetical protein